MDFINNIIIAINAKSSDNAMGASGDGVGLSVLKCTWIYKLYYYFLLILFFICFLWIIKDIYGKNHYSTNAIIGGYFKSQLRLSDIPEFNQIKNIVYITDYFSVDINFIYFIIVSIIIIAIAYYFHFTLNLKELYIEFNLFISFIVFVIISGIIYFIYNFSNINILSRRVNSLIQLIYSNINMQFINDQKICNYLQKKDKFDDNFVYGNCNDMKYLFNQSKLYSYITFQINEMHSADNNITVETFKAMKDSKGILYRDKLKNALFTYTIMRYYIDNNLLDDAKDFFSTYNLLKLTLKPRINPILNLNYDSILFNVGNYLNYDNPEIKRAFNNNKDIYNIVYNDFYNLNSNIQKIIVDIYNICKFKMISVYNYYLLIGLIMFCIVLYYFIKNYYNR